MTGWQRRHPQPWGGHPGVPGSAGTPRAGWELTQPTGVPGRAAALAGHVLAACAMHALRVVAACHLHVIRMFSTRALHPRCVAGACSLPAAWSLYDLRVFASRPARARRACCALSRALAARLHAHCTLAACLRAQGTLSACLLHPPSVFAAHTPHPLFAPCTLPAFFAHSHRTRRTLSARCLPHCIPSPKVLDPGGVGAMAGG